MAKVTIDESLCTGCGLCVDTCPDAFEIKDDSLAHVKNAGAESCDYSKAAEDCPVEAIKVE